MTWAKGATFTELTDLTNILEGDVIRMFRQAIDMFNQIKKASDNEKLRHKVNSCVGMIKREFVDVEF